MSLQRKKKMKTVIITLKTTMKTLQTTRVLNSRMILTAAKMKMKTKARMRMKATEMRNHLEMLMMRRKMMKREMRKIKLKKRKI